MRWEKSLDYRLFEHDGHAATLTARGRILAEHIVGPVKVLEDVAASITETTTGAGTRVIHIAGPREYLSARVIPLLPGPSQSGRSFRISFGLPNELLPRLAQGDLDLVVSTIVPHVKGVESVPLADEEFMLVSSPQWKSALDATGAITPDVLRRVPVVSYADDLPIVRRYWRSVFLSDTSDLELAAAIPNLREIARTVAAGLGMSVLPCYLVEDMLADVGDSGCCSHRRFRH